MTLTFDLYLTLTLSLTWPWRFEEIIVFTFEVTWRKNVTLYVKTEYPLQKSHDIMERFPTDQKSLSTSGLKVMAHYVIFTFF